MAMKMKIKERTVTQRRGGGVQRRVPFAFVCRLVLVLSLLIINYLMTTNQL